MAVYSYRATMKSGQIVNNKIEGTSIQEVKEKLKANGLTPITVRQAKGGFMAKFMPRQRQKKNQVSSAAVTKLAKEKLLEQQRKKQQQGLNRDISLDLSFLTRITVKDIISFTQSLFLLKRANFTNTRALTTLLENTENPKMKSIIEDLLNGVEAGEYIYATLEYYTDVFPQIYVSIIKIGEVSGNLTNALEQALIYIQESTATKKAVKRALSGPLMQAGGMLLLTIIGVLVGVPVLENLYDSMGVKDKIPPATVAVANFTRACAERWYLVVAFIIGGIFLFNLWKSTVNGRYRWDMFKLKMPIFGGLITRLALQKFFKAMQLNIATNAKLQDALEVSKGVVNNYVILSIIESAQDSLIQGDNWVEPFERLPNMPPMALEMLRIGMETDIGEMVDKIVEFLNDDIEITIEKIVKILPNVSMAIMGVVMVFFIIIVLKPVMELYTGSFLFEKYGM